MRISDWSSDVCSSDLLAHLRSALGEPAATRRIDQLPRLFTWRVLEGRTARLAAQRLRLFAAGGDAVHFRLDRLWRIGMSAKRGEIGRASCRARVCQYV